MVYFCAFTPSEIFQENARKSGVGRGQFDAGVNGLSLHVQSSIFLEASVFCILFYQTKNLKWGSVFVEPFTHLISAWCSEKAIKTPLENMMIGWLDHNPKRFYTEARTQKGEPYSKPTLLGFRHRIKRFLNSPPYDKGLHLASDLRFLRSNQMLDAQLINLKWSEKENVTQNLQLKKTISDN